MKLINWLKALRHHGDRRASLRTRTLAAGQRRKSSVAAVMPKVEGLEDRALLTFGAVLELSTLDGSNGFQINGEAAGDQFGKAVSNAGDINGDGIDDLIIGARGADPNGSASGASYVVFGKATSFGATLELSALDGSNGFKISGEAANDYSGQRLSAAGDINGDGLDDLIIASSSADPNGSGSGASYVVFGKRTAFAATLELSAVDGSNGFQINGEVAGDTFGRSVSAAGDINADGIDDLIIGAIGADPNGNGSGASYVVFGTRTAFGATLNLSTLDGSNGFQINGETANDFVGQSVSAAGDINGDGIDDVVIGAYRADPNGTSTGASYVVFGKGSAFGATLELSALDGSNGFQIDGEATDDRFGASVSAAGDINADGIDDLIIGAGGAAPNGTQSGASYVVFGSRAAFGATLSPSALDGSNGFKISGAAAGDNSGDSVSAAGDVNGDGIDDLIIGADGVDRTNPSGSVSGASYVVFGRHTAFGANLNLSALDGRSGFKINGEADGDRFGTSVSAAGDINGDGIDDVIVGARYSRPNGLSSGAGYVIFGQAAAPKPPVFGAEIELSALNGNDGFQINGEAALTNAGRSVSDAGDINGDGIDDVIIGARFASPNGSSSGASYVVFGKPTGFATPLNVADLNGSNGFKISGEAANDRSGSSVSAAGDINGDGIDDLIISAPYADPNGVNNPGASYVVFGSRTAFAANLNLSTLDGSNGFQINGEATNDGLNAVVSAAGDVNGDGIDDLLIGVSDADPNGSSSGASYVVFGKASGFGAELNLSDLTGSNGFQINGEALNNYSGRSLSAAGDINGDGFDDVVIGAFGATPNGAFSGATYVVFGSAAAFAATLNLSALNGSNGFKINGEAANNNSGWSVSGAGDVNADGIDDLIIGAYNVIVTSDSEGASYVVFGSRAGFGATLNLSSLDGSNGFQINGEEVEDYAGRSVSAAGDINQDGIDDLLIGADGADPNDDRAGASYVVFGSRTAFGPTLNLSTLDGSNGFQLNGIGTTAFSGTSVSNAGDVDGDGIDDLIIGAPSASTNAGGQGVSYVVFGRAFEATLSATIVGNDLVIEDVDEIGLANELSVSRSGSDLIISDANEAFFTSISGAVLSNSDKTVTIPASVLGSGGKVIVKGQGGNDSLSVNLSPELGTDVEFQGGSGTSDSLTLATDSVTSVTHTRTSANDGSITVDDGSVMRVISYTGIEPINDNLTAGQRTFEFSGGAETITVSDGTAADGKMLLDSTLGEPISFKTSLEDLTIDGGSGDDTITLLSIDAGLGASLHLKGGGGFDIINFNGDVTIAPGEDLFGEAETINVAAGVDLASQNSGGEGSLSFTADDISIDLTSTLVSPQVVNFATHTSGRALNLGTEASGSLSLTDGELDRITSNVTQITNQFGNITISAPITHENALTVAVGANNDIDFGMFSLASPISVIIATYGTGRITTADNSGSDIASPFVLIQSESGDIGSTTNFVRIAADKLSAISMANGAINVAAANVVEIASPFDSSGILGAGTGTITLGGGKFLTSSDDTIASAITVANGATLAGTGPTQAVNVQSGGHLAPGSSPAIFNSGDVSFSSGANFDVEIGGTTPGDTSSNHDQLVVTGTVSLGNATLNTSAFNSFVPTLGNTFAIILNDGTDAITGTFAQGTTITDFLGSGLIAVITYNANADGGAVGNDVTLTVANPGTLSASLSGGDLTIADTAAVANSLTVSISGSDLVFTDTTESFISAPAGGVLSNLNRTLTIPAASVTGTLTINSAGGTDTIDISALGTTLLSALTINAGAGTDTVNLNGDVTFATDKSLCVSAETVNTAASADLVTSGAGTISITADDVAIDTTSTLQSASTVTFVTQTAARPINLGTQTAGSLSLTDAVLDRVTSGTTLIGDSNSGTLTVSATITHANDLSLSTGAGVTVSHAVTMAADKDLSINSSSTTAAITLAFVSADLTTTGSGAVSITAARNIQLTTGASISTVDGGITVSANSTGLTTGDFDGLDVGNAVIQTTGTGNISLSGKGANNGNVNSTQIGVHLRSGASVSSTSSASGAGTITITGTGGSGTAGNYGVYLNEDKTDVTTVAGAIAITGTGGNGTGIGSFGVYLHDIETIQSTGTGANAGTITITGVAGSGTDSLFGLRIGGSTTDVTSIDGAITITGTGGNGSSNGNSGVVIESDATLQVTTSALTVTGTALTGNSVGVSLSTGDGGRLVSIGTGSITLTADGNGNSEDLVAGADSIIGDATHVGAASAATGNITISANKISFFGSAMSVETDGALVIAPLAAETTIGLGNSATGTLNMDAAELGYLQDGFSSITIGNAVAGTGAVDVNALTFIDNLTIVGGPISVTGLNAGTNSVTLTARTGAITDGGDSATDVTGGAVTLQTLAGSGGTIGATGDHLSVSATSLATNSSASNGNQFLSGASTAVVGTSDLNAGTSTITLGSGSFVTATGGGDILSPAIVANGATLSGTGTTGAITVQSGGHVAPGTSPGVLNSGDVSFSSGSSFDVEIGGTTPGNTSSDHDQLVVTGTVDLGSATLNTSAFNSFVPVTGNSFALLLNDGTDAITGTFNGLPEGGVISNFFGTGLNATISYVGNADGGASGNDVVLTVGTAPTLTASIVESRLTITDADGSKNNSLTLSVSGSNIVITDANEAFMSAPAGGTLSNSNKTLTIPASSVTRTLTINSTGGADTIAVSALGSTLLSELRINTGTGNDTLNFNGDVTFAPGKDSYFNAETINVAAGTDLVAQTVAEFGSLQFVADDMSIASTSTLVSGASVEFTSLTAGRTTNLGTQAVGTLSLTQAQLDRVTASKIYVSASAAGVTLSAPIAHASALVVQAGADHSVDLGTFSLTSAIGLEVTSSGTGGITTADNSGTDISAPYVFLATGSGGAGSSTNFVRIAADRFSVSTNNGPVFVTEADAVEIDYRNSTDGLLDAGTAAITLGGGTFVTSSDDLILSSITVANGATLAGTGPTQAVSVQSGGHLAPGSSPAIFNSGDVSFSSGSNLDVEINGTTVGTGYDQLSVTGTVNLGSAMLNVTLGFTPMNGASFTIIANDGSDAVTGTFNGLPEGGSFTVSSTRFLVSYVGGTGNDVVLTVQNDVTAPTADVIDITPDPRTTNAGVVSIDFDEAVTGVDISDFTLTRDGKSVDISGLSVSGSSKNYTLDLTTVTVANGKYELTLNKTGSGVVDASSNALAANATDDWTRESPTVSLSVNNASIAETGSATVTATLSQATDVDVTIDLGVTGTASGKTDYTTSGSQIVISKGQTTGSVTVFSTDDTLDEPMETVIVSLGALSNATPGSETSTTIFINDNDAAPISAKVQSGKLVISDTQNIATDVRVTFNSGTSQFAVTSFTEGVAATVFNFASASVTNGLQATLGSQSDRFDVSGVSLRTTISGGDGNDSILGSQGIDSVLGGAGNDNLQLNNGDDIALGGDGNDVLRGGAGRDSLVGDAGNDSLFGQGAVDSLVGGNGIDLLDGGDSGTSIDDDFAGDLTLTNTGYQTTRGDRVVAQAIGYATLTGSAGNDNYNGQSFNSGIVTVFGGDGDDTLRGGATKDVFYGDGGNDIVNGGGNQDVLFGGDGNDTVNGVGASDVISGGPGNDHLIGGDGANRIREDVSGSFTLVTTNGVVTMTGLGTDVIDGSFTTAFIVGGSSADTIDLSAFAGMATLFGGDGNDSITGTMGEDRLYGGNNNDVLNGQNGNDLLVGEAGDDVLNGNVGDDLLRGGAGTDTIDGGDGSDRQTEQANDNFAVIGLQISSATTGTETPTNIERINLQGGSSANLIDARQSSLPVLLVGGNGNDTLFGSAFDDTLQGDSGDDVLSGGAGNDELRGGNGTDTQYESLDADATITGHSIIAEPLGTDVIDSGDPMEAVILIGGASNNSFNASAATVPVTLLGGEGDDTLIGGSHPDVLIGGNRASSTAGVDSLTGNGGVDILDNDPADTHVGANSDTVLANLFATLPSWIDAL